MTLGRAAYILMLLSPGIGLIVVFIGAVVYIAVAQSFGYYNLIGESGFSWSFWIEGIDRKSYLRAVRYSLYVGLTSAFLSVALAYPLALWLRKPFPGSMTISAILKAPLLVHGIVAAFLFLNVISYHGILNQMMVWLGIFDEPRRLQNDEHAIGLIFLQVWKNMPFALLLLTGAVQAISDDVLNAAQDLGAGAWQRFLTVIAPLTVSAMQASLIIIFIGALADFTFQTTIGPTNERSLAQYMTFMKDRGRWNDAAVVGVTLMALSLAGSVLLAVVSRLAFRGRRK
ncbi:ABC transporter permease [Salinarimonas ramus]|uniref:Spermidine/putrescine ABC transporter permease n=1 Tax=Salinarimonas ramus TaxID=690164 RepID=A0A917QJ93_9HYPH|nr:ABC transporter permease subunit [Salinarimonas ramus]GGK51703.1 spermidine/putrescine ABC transporter permease [Salinarimonas ramus]